jgi:hypothetical protein
MSNIPGALRPQEHPAAAGYTQSCSAKVQLQIECDIP